MSSFDAGTSGQRPWLWNVRGPDLIEIDGQLDGYASAKVTIKDGDVGSFELVLPIGHWAVPYLLIPGAGVVVRLPGRSTVISSGPVSHSDGSYAADGNTLTFTGPSDDWILASDVAWPDPLHGLNDAAGGNVISGHTDTRTGTAEAVLLGYVRDNLGSTAWHGTDGALTLDRRRPLLSVPTSAGRGTTGSYQADFTPLLEIAQTICATSGITWTMRQVTGSALVALAIRARVNVSANVAFSQAEGSIQTATFSRTAPTVTQAIAITDSGSVRSYATVTDTVAEGLWALRCVSTVDSSSAVLADATAAAAAAIAAGLETAGASLVPVTLPGAPVLGLDYQLGDTVAVIDASGFAITDRLVQIDYVHAEGAAPVVSPSIGLSATDQSSALVPLLRALQSQLVTLTRRRRQ